MTREPTIYAVIRDIYRGLYRSKCMSLATASVKKLLNYLLHACITAKLDVRYGYVSRPAVS